MRLPILSASLVSLLLASAASSRHLCAQSAAAPATEAKQTWEADLQKRHDALIRANGPGTDAGLRAQLLSMGMQDQEARGIMNGQPMDKARYTQADNLREVDKNLTAQLKEIVGKSGWPTIALAGYEASNAAMVILIHTADHTWQRSLLPDLEQLADAGKIDGSPVATLVDKELISEGKLQRYGTQFKVLGDRMAMFAVEDPAGLDARRAKVFLPPIEPYEQRMSELYHLKVSKEIVTATR